MEASGAAFAPRQVTKVSRIYVSWLRFSLTLDNESTSVRNYGGCMPVTIVCDGCGKELRPSLHLSGHVASISLMENHVTLGCNREGTIMISCSEACRAIINAQYSAGAVVDPDTGQVVVETVTNGQIN
jgi:hypothetical protein